MSSREIKSTKANDLWSERRKALKPKPLQLSQEGLISTSFLKEDKMLPLVVQPNLDGVDLPAWAGNNLEFIEKNLTQYGGILFRGFALGSQEDFELFLDAISLAKMYYMEGATPRTELSDKVYTSTEYPPDHSIALHNELNYVATWPMKIFFFCVTPSEQGGETPIADVRKVFDRIPPRIRDRFVEKGWMLVRNFSDGLSLPWQTAFRVNTREELEHYCGSAGVEFEWIGESRLRTCQVRPAVRKYPKTGEFVWFNHVAFWHISSLEPDLREMFLAEFKQEDLPYNTYYGDGSPIENDVVEEIREAYRQETVASPWQKGDLLMMNNMLVAHGRNPYVGARRILASMGEPSSNYGF